ncbi:MAG TPA: hypothetical protein VMR95_03105 [Candidatus Binatia bacterium]|jgi:hypothetical protein|nr:hypothetical protein [Candidatus Binatia bacterium]
MNYSSETVNKVVDVNSFYFKRAGSLKTFPKQIEVDGRSYVFIENGLRLLIRKGQSLVELFDMTDGQSTFRLRRESNQWTLVGIKAGV